MRVRVSRTDYILALVALTFRSITHTRTYRELKSADLPPTLEDAGRVLSTHPPTHSPTHVPSTEQERLARMTPEARAKTLEKQERREREVCLKASMCACVRLFGQG